jgi:hypothetical protein
MFKWKDDTSIEQIREIEQEFCALPGRIDAIYDFEWGTNISERDLNEGLTHCFVVTFRDEAGLAAYLPHPAHEAFRDLIMPHVDKLLVVDYWTKE